MELITIREGHQKKRIAFWTFNKYISVTLVVLLNVFSNCQPEITLVALIFSIVGGTGQSGDYLHKRTITVLYC